MNDADFDFDLENEMLCEQENIPDEFDFEPDAHELIPIMESNVDEVSDGEMKIQEVFKSTR